MSRIARAATKGFIMLAAAGLAATLALPAYARTDSDSVTAITHGLRDQTMSVGAVAAPAVARDSYSVAINASVLDSTVGTSVAPEVQSLAQQLMQAVAQGRLIGSVPNHIPEIEYLAQGKVVPNCGVDYRVLQAISFALTKFNQVGVSDINRKCTGQIEGAGTESAHYADGGGHAVDFYMLNGQALTGGDPLSIQLIEDLNQVVPPMSGLGQQECRASLAVSNFNQFADTCNHVHIDFLWSKGTSLKVNS